MSFSLDICLRTLRVVTSECFRRMPTCRDRHSGQSCASFQLFNRRQVRHVCSGHGHHQYCPGLRRQCNRERRHAAATVRNLRAHAAPALQACRAGHSLDRDGRAAADYERSFFVRHCLSGFGCCLACPSNLVGLKVTALIRAQRLVVTR